MASTTRATWAAPTQLPRSSRVRSTGTDVRGGPPGTGGGPAFGGASAYCGEGYGAAAVAYGAVGGWWPGADWVAGTARAAPQLTQNALSGRIWSPHW